MVSDQNAQFVFQRPANASENGTEANIGQHNLGH